MSLVKRSLTTFITLMTLVAPSACKNGVGGIAGGEGDGGGGSSVTSINIALPSRDGMKAAVPDIETKMNSYHLLIAAVQPAACKTPTAIDEVAAYGAKPALTASLKQGCDYDVTLELGNNTVAAAGGQTGQTGATGAAKVSYEGKIKTIIANNCTKCHAGLQAPNLATFAGAKAQGARILERINSTTTPMPPVGNTAVAQADRDALKAWSDGGFVEKDGAGLQGEPKKLVAVYYKNTTALRIKKEEINGKPELKVALALQLQEAGRAIGLGGGAVTTTTPPTTTPPTTTPPAGTTTLGAKDINLLGPTGDPKKLSQLLTGKYILMSFATSTCTACAAEATKLNADLALQGLLANAKCTFVTVVPPTDLTPWHTASGGTGTFVGKNSYSQVDNVELAQLVATIGGTYTAGTPSFVLLDAAGTKVADGAAIPDAAVKQNCTP